MMQRRPALQQLQLFQSSTDLSMPNLNEQESSESIDFDYRLNQGMSRDQQIDFVNNEDNEPKE